MCYRNELLDITALLNVFVQLPRSIALTIAVFNAAMCWYCKGNPSGYVVKITVTPNRLNTSRRLKKDLLPSLATVFKDKISVYSVLRTSIIPRNILLHAFNLKSFVYKAL
jgi:hypothetical protein